MSIIHTSVASLSMTQRRRARRFSKIVQSEFKAMVDKAHQRAWDLTSGTVSKKTLRMLGHPFSRAAAKKRPRGIKGQLSALGVPRLPINVQRGRLRRSLRVNKEITSTDLEFTLSFGAPHAKYVLKPGGTRAMVARGFWSAMRKSVGGYYKTYLRRTAVRLAVSRRQR